MNEAHNLRKQMLAESEKYFQLYKECTKQLSNNNTLKNINYLDGAQFLTKQKFEILREKIQAQIKDDNIKIQDEEFNSFEDVQSVSIAQVGIMPPAQAIDASRNNFESTSQNDITHPNEKQQIHLLLNNTSVSNQRSCFRKSSSNSLNVTSQIQNQSCQSKDKPVPQVKTNPYKPPEPQKVLCKIIDTSKVTSEQQSSELPNMLLSPTYYRNIQFQYEQDLVKNRQQTYNDLILNNNEIQKRKDFIKMNKMPFDQRKQDQLRRQRDSIEKLVKRGGQNTKTNILLKNFQKDQKSLEIKKKDLQKKQNNQDLESINQTLLQKKQLSISQASTPRGYSFLKKKSSDEDEIPNEIDLMIPRQIQNNQLPQLSNHEQMALPFDLVEQTSDDTNQKFKLINGLSIISEEKGLTYANTMSKKNMSKKNSMPARQSITQMELNQTGQKHILSVVLKAQDQAITPSMKESHIVSLDQTMEINQFKLTGKGSTIKKNDYNQTKRNNRFKNKQEPNEIISYADNSGLPIIGSPLPSQLMDQNSRSDKGNSLRQQFSIQTISNLNNYSSVKESQEKKSLSKLEKAIQRASASKETNKSRQSSKNSKLNLQNKIQKKTKNKQIQQGAPKKKSKIQTNIISKPTKKHLVLKILNQNNQNSGHNQAKENEPITESLNEEFSCKKSEAIKILDQDLKEIFDQVSYKQFIPLRRLGTGSFGNVYLVRHQPTQSIFAMKALSKRNKDDQAWLRYLLTERNVLVHLQKSSFVAKLKYAFQTTDNLFLVTEFCPGGDLERLLTVEKYINEDRAKIYIAEIILSIAELHKKDIIYRDLKPDNVVIDEQGHASLIDFGMAKEGVKEVHKGADTFCGSIKYLAPEMLRKKGYGKSLDWYLVGVLLYEMLVGVTPYYTQDKDQLFENILQGKLKLPKSISLEARDLIVQLLNRNPQKRLGAPSIQSSNSTINEYDLMIEQQNEISKEILDSLPKGIDQIMNHPFFNEISWSLLLKRDFEGVHEFAKKKIQGTNKVFDLPPLSKYSIQYFQERYQNTRFSQNQIDTIWHSQLFDDLEEQKLYEKNKIQQKENEKKKDMKIDNWNFVADCLIDQFNKYLKEQDNKKIKNSKIKQKTQSKNNSIGIQSHISVETLSNHADIYVPRRNLSKQGLPRIGRFNKNGLGSRISINSEVISNSKQYSTYKQQSLNKERANSHDPKLNLMKDKSLAQIRRMKFQLQFSRGANLAAHKASILSQKNIENSKDNLNSLMKERKTMSERRRVQSRWSSSSQGFQKNTFSSVQKNNKVNERAVSKISQNSKQQRKNSYEYNDRNMISHFASSSSLGSKKQFHRLKIEKKSKKPVERIIGNQIIIKLQSVQGQLEIKKKGETSKKLVQSLKEVKKGSQIMNRYLQALQTKNIIDSQSQNSQN